MCLVYTLFWSVIVLIADCALLHDAARQFAAQNYPATTATIAESQVHTNLNRKGGTTYQADVRYYFQADGKTIFGERFRYGMQPADKESAERLVSAFPAGGKRQVYYNAHDPGDCILMPGIQGLDMMWLLLLTPMNAIMAGFCLWSGGWLRERLFRPLAGGVKIFKTKHIIRVRMPRYAQAGWALATVSSIGSISAYALGFSIKEKPMSIEFALGVFAVITLAGTAVYFWKRQEVYSGEDDVVINQITRTIELPPTHGRTQRLIASISDIKSISVEKISLSRRRAFFSYAPAIRLCGNPTKALKLADWHDELKAIDFTNWLRAQLVA